MRSYMYNILRYPEQVADGEMITGKLCWCGQSSSNGQKSCWAPTHLKKKKTAQKNNHQPTYPELNGIEPSKR